MTPIAAAALRSRSINQFLIPISISFTITQISDVRGKEETTAVLPIAYYNRTAQILCRPSAYYNILLSANTLIFGRSISEG